MKVDLSKKESGQYVWNSRFTQYDKVIKNVGGEITTAKNTIFHDGRYIMRFDARSSFPAFFEDHEQHIEFIRQEAEKYKNLQHNPNAVKESFEKMRKDLHG